ncbi:NAD(P)H-hydrate dehydratase [Alloscardovia venturai]|uniref:ADP-dependent (S)-NAD(P)H-hydrate dehydratase n=1 Tax=Alloscardovia venturai TaxID=1769421 RepID=A0ABW2Y6L8_9BIFI
MQFLPEHLDGLFEVPCPDDSKYTRGVVGLITGTDEYPGAGVLSVSAAASCGIGYVRYNGPAAAVNALLITHPEVVFTACAENHVDAWVVGSGFSGIYDNGDCRSDEIRQILTSKDDELHKNVPYVVVDAGALETYAVMAMNGELDADQRARCVLTPHTGEAERLCTVLGLDMSRDYIESHREVSATVIAHKLGCTVVLKGSPTIVASHDGTAYELPPATHWLATAGTGDLLAGIMGATIASNASRLREGKVNLARVAAAAVCVHSYAAGLSAFDMTSMEEWLGDSPDNVSSDSHLYGHQIGLLDMTSAISAAQVDFRNWKDRNTRTAENSQEPDVNASESGGADF